MTIPISREVFAKHAKDTAERIGLRMDAGETAAFLRALEDIDTTITEYEYPGLKLKQFVPPLNVEEGADYYTFRTYDRVGYAKFIANYGDDLPNISRYGTENTSKIESIGVEYEYSIQDLRRAAKLNFPLDSTMASDARDYIERLKDRVGALGDANRGIVGLAKNANVPIISAGGGITGGWGTATPTQILTDLFTLAYSVWTQSKQTHTPQTLLLPPSSYATISSTFYSATIPTTLRSVFLETNGLISNIEPWLYLETAGATSNKRAIIYDKDPKNLGLVEPIPFESLPPQARGLEFVVPCHSRFGGVVIKRPLAFLYADGI